MNKHATLTVSLLIGLLVAALAYYAMTTVPPGSSLPLCTEVTSTQWSNISFNEDTSNSAEIAYVVRVNHSPVKGVISLTLGIFAGVLAFRFARENSKYN